MSGRTAAIVASAAVVAVSYVAFQSVRKYGVTGTVRYIWEGDHLEPEVRRATDRLEEAALSLPQHDTLLEHAEIAKERARLDAVDGDNDESSSAWHLVPQWILNYEGDLERDIYMTSQNLDSLAAKIDSVPSCQDPSIRQKKKVLSRAVVKLMERADALLKFYEDLGSTGD